MHELVPKCPKPHLSPMLGRKRPFLQGNKHQPAMARSSLQDLRWRPPLPSFHSHSCPFAHLFLLPFQVEGCPWEDHGGRPVEIDGSEGRGEAQPASCLPHTMGPAPCPLPHRAAFAGALLQARRALGGQRLHEVLLLISMPPNGVVSVNKESAEGVRVSSPP